MNALEVDYRRATLSDWKLVGLGTSGDETSPLVFTRAKLARAASTVGTAARSLTPATDAISLTNIATPMKSRGFRVTATLATVSGDHVEIYGEELDRETAEFIQSF